MDMQLVRAAVAIVVVAVIVSVIIGIVYRSVKACLGCATVAVMVVVLAAAAIYAWQQLGP